MNCGLQGAQRRPVEQRTAGLAARGPRLRNFALEDGGELGARPRRGRGGDEGRASAGREHRRGPIGKLCGPGRAIAPQGRRRPSLLLSLPASLSQRRKAPSRTSKARLPTSQDRLRSEEHSVEKEYVSTGQSR